MQPSSKEIEHGLETAFRWVMTTLARPGQQVEIRYSGDLPMLYEVLISGAIVARLLVLGAEVLRENAPFADRDESAFSDYLRRIRLLERRDWDLDRVVGFFASFGPSPAPRFRVGTGFRGPTAAEVTHLEWGDGQLELVLYDRVEVPSGPQSRGGFSPTESFLRATLHLREDYVVRWVVERSDRPRPKGLAPTATATGSALQPPSNLPVVQIGPPSASGSAAPNPRPLFGPGSDRPGPPLCNLPPLSSPLSVVWYPFEP